MRRATTLLTVGAGVAAAVVARRRRRVDLFGRVVLVTGAARGLGMLMAREFAARGCTLVICDRAAGELAATRNDLVSRGAEVLAVPCDVTDREQVAALVARTVQTYGSLDILVNNAGIIQVAPMLDLSVDDFLAAVEVMQLGPIYLTYEALPHLRAATPGRIVNITSIGGKVPVPHLLPYVSAKFGAVGFSQGLHAELARHGVRVTTVVPGLMRTGSHLRASFSGQQSREFTWFAIAASLPVLSMDAERAARRIVNAAVAGRAEVTTTPVAVIASRLAGVAPAATARVSSLAARLLPEPAGTREPARPGRQVGAAAPSRIRSALTTLGRRAADRFQPATGPRA
jgi:NAD(P)-dependent dehydrogenase (short-subunit alcohol dehydrogenase family)